MVLNIQFMRAIAAMLVVFFHTAPHYGVLSDHAVPSEDWNLFRLFKEFGYMGVDIFFIISGFIMWYTTKKYTMGGVRYVASFLYNRLTRIYLGYWVFFVIVLLGYYYIGRDLSKIDIVSSFFLTTAHIKELLIPVAWTLAYELYFYFCFAILLFVNIKIRLRMISLTLVFLILIQGYVYFFAHNKLYLPLYGFFLSPYCLEFIMGILIAYFFESHRVKYVLPLFVLAIFLLVSGIEYQHMIPEGSLVGGTTVHQRILFFGIASALLIIVVVELNYRKKELFPKLSHLIGDASYSIYLSHTLILMGIYLVGLNRFEFMHKHTFFALMLIVLFIVIYSALHYTFIEKPLLRAAKRYKKKWFRLSE